MLKSDAWICLVSQRKTGKHFKREHTEKRNILSGDKMKKWIKTVKAFLSLKSLIVQMGSAYPAVAGSISVMATELCV